MRNVFLLAMACVAFFASMNAYAESPKEDQELLQGTWILKKGESNGIDLGEVLKKQGIEKLLIEFSGDTMKMSGHGSEAHSFQFKLKPDEKPKALDAIAGAKSGKAESGTTMPGIYKIDGDTLTLCLSNEPTVDRPKEFKAPAGARLSLLVLTREKP